MKIITYEEACKEAFKLIAAEASGKILGLKTRFESFNRAYGKYIRPGTFTVLAGLSGSGKSLLLNLLQQDFVNPLLNPAGADNCAYNEVIVLHFNFEMSAASEIIRTISYEMKASYNSILSSEWNYDDNIYNQLNKEELRAIQNFLKATANKNILFIEEACSISKMGEIIGNYRSKYPKAFIVVTLDHTLLLKAEENQHSSEIEVIANFSKAAMHWKKNLYIAIISLAQMNSDIQETNRREKSLLHYPIRKDLFGSKQLGHAADTIGFLHRPETMGITLYGPEAIPSQDLAHFLWEKGRNNGLGSTWFEFAPLQGGLIERSKDYFKNRSSPIKFNY